MENKFVKLANIDSVINTDHIVSITKNIYPEAPSEFYYDVVFVTGRAVSYSHDKIEPLLLALSIDFEAV